MVQIKLVMISVQTRIWLFPATYIIADHRGRLSLETSDSSTCIYVTRGSYIMAQTPAMVSNPPLNDYDTISPSQLRFEI